jgi:hypothetical protein
MRTRPSFVYTPPLLLLAESIPGEAAYGGRGQRPLATLKEPFQ